MSTKSTIKYGEGFHLYTDGQDKWDSMPEFIYLEIRGARVEVFANEKGCEAVIGMPRTVAEELGLIPKR